MKNSVLTFVISLLLFSSINTIAQKNKKNDSIKFTAVNKGKIFVSWGGNRGQYSHSDITFKGNDYNFKLYDVTAHDKPKGWHIDYINPGKMTIPQTNFKLGYFVSEKYTVSIGVDHMKYVMTQNQNVNIDGTINLPAGDPGAINNGDYNNEDIKLIATFLTFEHTDGLNYIYTEFARYDDISSIFRINNTDKFQVNITEGVAGGVLFPKTNTMLLLKERYDEFHVAGFGFSLHAGINLTLYKHFVIQGNLKGGYINMPDIRTTKDAADSASQDFFYFQQAIAIGWIFRI